MMQTTSKKLGVMRLEKWALGSFVAFIVVIAGINTAFATPAMTFTVSVNNVEGLGRFIPFSYTETVNFDTYVAAPVYVYSGAPVTNAGGAVSFSGDPLTASLLAMIDPTTPQAFLDAQLVNYPTYTDGWIRLVSQSTTLKQHADGLWYYDQFYKQFFISPSDVHDPNRGQLMDFAHLEAIISTANSMHWSEFVSRQIAVDSTGFQPVSGGFSLGYSGTAAFVAASVPEPSASVLLGISLLGLLGYNWRKRQQTA
jgi:hypothetical protein